MIRAFTLEYWIDDGWYIGRLKEVPSVFSQGSSLKELKENIKDAYKLMREEEILSYSEIQKEEIRIEV
ncbi:MAG: type II toxin-antitoxin system HicB family antitoxin [bacterium]